MATTKQAPAKRCYHRDADGKRDCQNPTVRPSAAACRDHTDEWLAAHYRKPTAMSYMSAPEIAKARAARKAKAAAKPKATTTRAAKQPNSAGTSPKATPRPRAKKAATPEERIARTVHKSTPPAPPREPIARVKAAAVTPTVLATA